MFLHIKRALLVIPVPVPNIPVPLGVHGSVYGIYGPGYAEQARVSAWFTHIPGFFPHCLHGPSVSI